MIDKHHQNKDNNVIDEYLPFLVTVSVTVGTITAVTTCEPKNVEKVKRELERSIKHEPEEP